MCVDSTRGLGLPPRRGLVRRAKRIRRKTPSIRRGPSVDERTFSADNDNAARATEISQVRKSMIVFFFFSFSILTKRSVEADRRRVVISAKETILCHSVVSQLTWYTLFVFTLCLMTRADVELNKLLRLRDLLFRRAARLIPGE